MITKQITETLEILPDGTIQVKETTEVVEDGVVIASSDHRRCVLPDEDQDKESSEKVKKVLQHIVTPEQKQAAAEKRAARNK
jgi:hypothetical protein